LAATPAASSGKKAKALAFSAADFGSFQGAVDKALTQTKRQLLDLFAEPGSHRVSLFALMKKQDNHANGMHELQQSVERQSQALDAALVGLKPARRSGVPAAIAQCHAVAALQAENAFTALRLPLDLAGAGLPPGLLDAGSISTRPALGYVSACTGSHLTFSATPN
jgi:hypothetical protein